MKKLILLIGLVVILLSCKDDNIVTNSKKDKFVITNSDKKIENDTINVYYKIKLYNIPSEYTITGYIVSAETEPIIYYYKSMTAVIDITKISNNDYYINIKGNKITTFIIHIKTLNKHITNYLVNFTLEYVNDEGNKERIPLKNLI